MGIDKQGSKGRGGFFHLFDWNGKSRKKLFSNEPDVREEPKQGKKSEENLPRTRVCLSEEDEIQVLSAKGGADLNCVSSSMGNEGSGIKPPSVVARLMGLDSLPASSVMEPNSTPYFEPQYLWDTNYEWRAPDPLSEFQSVYTKNQSNRASGFYRKESIPPKLPSSPIEKFKFEALPPKSAKSYPLMQHKLLSPIRSPGFISGNDAAHIMEAAAKIIEPGLQANSRAKIPSTRSASIPIKIRDLKENARTSQRASKLAEVPRRLVESNAVKYLKGQSLNKSWNGSEATSNFKASQESCSYSGRNKGKSVSLAIQAKVNVQKREGSNSSNRGSSALKEEDGHKLIDPCKSHQNTAKKSQNKSSTGQKNSCVVLRQNNQKQNCQINKSKLPVKPSISNRQERKLQTGDSSFRQNTNSNRLSGNSRISSKKEVSTVTGLEKHATLTRTKNFPRRKQAIEENGFVDSVSLDSDDKKLVQTLAEKSEHMDLSEDNKRQGIDVVSFTFTSPMVKPLPGTQSADQMVEKLDIPGTPPVDSANENNASKSKIKGEPALGLNVMGGDALSILLEQKLRELTSSIESSSSNSVKLGVGTASSSILQDVVSSLDSASSMPKAMDFPAGHKIGKLEDGSNSRCSSTTGQEFKMNHHLQLQGVEQYGSSTDVQKELDYHHSSPASILEATFSNESCNSSESLCSSTGSKLNSSIETVGYDSSAKSLSVDAEAELSDSASSAFTGAVDQEHVQGISTASPTETGKQELEYVKEILSHAELNFEDLSLAHPRSIINSHLFNRLEDQKASRSDGDDKGGRLRRKELFDCVSECVGLKCSHYVSRGYKAWLKGAVIIRNERLSDEICRDVMEWSSMGNWMVDELVEKDMSSHIGSWLNFETEAFELGVEIERSILSSLVNEAIADMF